MPERSPSAAEIARVDDALLRMQELDLTGICSKLSDVDEGPGWSAGAIEAAVAAYRQFLALNAAYPDEAIVPDRTVDTVWHYHILDTRAYAEDTRRVFGYFLHHYPYFGMRGEADRCRLQESFANTQALLDAHFGDPALALSAVSSCQSSSCSKCSRG